MKNQVDTLLQREMSRGEFLKVVGLAALSLTGISSLVHLLDRHSRQASKGYGASPYGR